jgi:hypothetical protein
VEIRRGWYLGKETFRHRLMKLLDKVTEPVGGNRNRTDEVLRDPGKCEAAWIVRQALKSLRLASATESLAKFPKSDPREAALVSLLRERTSVGNKWSAERLAMGYPGTVNRMPGAVEHPWQCRPLCHFCDPSFPS